MAHVCFKLKKKKKDVAMVQKWKKKKKNYIQMGQESEDL